MVVLITTEGMVFLCLLAAYFFISAGSPLASPGIPLQLHRRSCSVVLLASGIPIFWMERLVTRSHAPGGGARVAFLMGPAFLGNTAYDYLNRSSACENAYASLFWVILGLHAIHVFVGLLMSATVQVKVWTGRVTPEHHVTPEVFALYWHFVDGVWLFVFAALFLSPHLR
jgi:cytochrome c oxidase subunit 3